MPVLGVIPARLGSTRLWRKPLQPLGGVPLIVRVAERVSTHGLVDRLVIATDSPEIITGDNYESRARTLFDELIRCKVNIFNISKINSEVRGGKSPRIKRLSEYIGESYFDYLANPDDLVLLMDESHRYRASAGVRAINELRPILGLELTATPQIEKGTRAEPFDNVIYSYPLSEALKDGFVKDPAVATRENFDVIASAGREASYEELQAMLRTMLADRFKLALRRETRQLPVYELIAGRNGLKIAPMKPGRCVEMDQAKPFAPLNICGGVRRQIASFAPERRDFIEAVGAPMPTLIEFLSDEVGRVVVDRTGLTGFFDVELTSGRTISVADARTLADAFAVADAEIDCALAYQFKAGDRAACFRAGDAEQSERYVRVAVGRDYADVPPSRGVYKGTADETHGRCLAPSEQRRGHGGATRWWG